MSNLKKGAVIFLIALLIGAVASYFLTKRYFKAKIGALKPHVVQVIQYDTITAYFPIEIEKRIIDTIRLSEIDTLVLRDTIFLQREQRVYEDSTYRAVVSGVAPRLDSISVYQRTITKIATQKEWRKFTYGVQLGVGLVAPFNSSPSFGGYVGIGVGYNF